MPFDGVTSNIGEEAVLNPNGGAVAFYWYYPYGLCTGESNLSTVPLCAGYSAMWMASRLHWARRIGWAPNDIMMGSVVQGEKDNSENHLQYSLLGDPALSLNLPQMKVVVDSINGVDCATD